MRFRDIYLRNKREARSAEPNFDGSYKALVFVSVSVFRVSGTIFDWSILRKVIKKSLLENKREARSAEHDFDGLINVEIFIKRPMLTVSFEVVFERFSPSQGYSLKDRRSENKREH